MAQVIITTYQTLNLDFSTPDGVEEDDKLDWLIENGYGILDCLLQLFLTSMQRPSFTDEMVSRHHR